MSTELMMWERRIRADGPVSVIFDVGANVGDTTKGG